MFASIESCYFNGGQFVKYSDGSILITGSYSYDLYVASASNGGYAEYDRLSNSITMIVPPTVSALFHELSLRQFLYLRAIMRVRRNFAKSL